MRPFALDSVGCLRLQHRLLGEFATLVCQIIGTIDCVQLRCIGLGQVIPAARAPFASRRHRYVMAFEIGGNGEMVADRIALNESAYAGDILRFALRILTDYLP